MRAAAAELMDVVAESVSETMTALSALPPPPVRRALHLGRCAGIAAQRVAWYSALAGLTLLARAEPDAPPDAKFTAPPPPASWRTMLMVLAVIGAQTARRRGRGTFAG